MQGLGVEGLGSGVRVSHRCGELWGAGPQQTQGLGLRGLGFRVHGSMRQGGLWTSKTSRPKDLYKCLATLVQPEVFCSDRLAVVIRSLARAILI